MAERVEVVLYGATGYTGPLVAAELARRGARLAIAGRNRDKLEALAGTLPTRPEIIVADAADPPSLQGMAARGRVVLSCAGPFAELGPPVQEACLKARSCFVDITGETNYMLDTYARNQAWVDAGLTAVNAAGFDVVPTDVAAWLAADGLDKPERVDIALAVSGVEASQGTRRSATRMITADTYGWVDGAFKPVGAGEWVREVDFGGGLGRRAAVYVPIGDVATAPRTTGARTVRTFVAMPSKLAADVLGGVMRFSSTAPVRAVLGSGVVKGAIVRVVGTGNDGPDDDARQRTRFTIRAEAVSRGRTRWATVAGVDPYGLTAVTSTAIALRLARDADVPRGVLSPCQAIGDVRAFLPTLTAFGLSIDDGG